MPTIEHIIFIPGVFMIGMVTGYVLGARAVRSEIERKKRRSRE